MASRPFSRRTQSSLLAALLLVASALLALPVVVVVRSGSASADHLWTALRLAGLEALTLVFLNIVTGSFRPVLARALGSRPAHRLHVTAGEVGLAVTVVHGVCAFVFGIAGYRVGPVWLGPTALLLSAAVVATALLRMHLRLSWRWVHRLSYLIFAVVAVHGVMVGSDLWAGPVLKVLLILYCVAVIACLTKRSFAWAKGAPSGGIR